MLLLATLIFMFRNSYSIPYKPLVWTEPASPLLPKPMSALITAYNNETESIWIIQGKTITEYNIANNNYTVYPDSSITLYATYSQTWTQRNNIIYAFESDGYIATFDMNSGLFISDINISSIEVDYPLPCLASNNDYLFATGGDIWPATQNLTIYSFDDDLWLNGPPMLIARSLHACNVVNDMLYVIGGRNQIEMDSVHMIDVSDIINIENTNWIILDDTLSETKHALRSVEYNSYIYVLGGIVPYYVRNSVDIIDTNTNSISYDSDLVTGVWQPGAVVADNYNMIFIFGGYSTTGFDSTDKMQYATFMETSTPTESPTVYPSINATTSNPTSTPSINPTTEPTTTEPTLDTTASEITDGSNHVAVKIIFMLSLIIYVIFT